MGPDINAETEIYEDLDEDSIPLFEPLFDPIAFSELHGELKIRIFKLSQQEL